jgi:hypothetical protein
VSSRAKRVAAGGGGFEQATCEAVSKLTATNQASTPCDAKRGSCARGPSTAHLYHAAAVDGSRRAA